MFLMHNGRHINYRGARKYLNDQSYNKHNSEGKKFKKNWWKWLMQCWFPYLDLIQRHQKQHEKEREKKGKMMVKISSKQRKPFDNVSVGVEI